ncbi:MAG TPA: Ig-like domain repeat protein [Candidatus Koribacter sp.]|jgi:FtsP/CotA-like multicopper oxidase with cupredoxin domain
MRPARPSCILRLLSALILLVVSVAHAQSPDPADSVCPRSAEGSTVAQPPDLYSSGGKLEVTFNFKTTTDDNGLPRYCYITDTGLQAPTLHVNPGDQLIIHFNNQLPPVNSGAHHHMAAHATVTTDIASMCNATDMTAASTNIHFHGMNVAPVCQQDDVLNTLIQPTQSFDYVLPIPLNEPSGLYWYHPHPHGFSEGQVQGGATGALIVEGIETIYPQLASLPERTIVMRDQLMSAAEMALSASDSNAPIWDFNINYVPITYPNYTPAVIQTAPNTQEFWRVLNSDADLILDLQVVINGVPQPLQVYATDGVAVPVANGPITMTTIELGPGARAEFVVTTPNTGDTAQFLTIRHDTGPGGENEPPRPIANIVATSSTTTASATHPRQVKLDPNRRVRFDSLKDITPAANRRIGMSEEGENEATTQFFINVEPGGFFPFYMAEPPQVVSRQGTVEQWRVENLTDEDHIFHIHQIHFVQIAADDAPVDNPAILDTIRVPHHDADGTIHSVTLLMDFRDPNIIGTFVFHCHILAHEDAGMMAKIQVLPPALATTLAVALSPNPPVSTGPTTLTATITPSQTGAGSFTGQVTFTIDGASFPATPSAEGVATYSTTFATGSHSVSASFAGDDIYAPATGNTASFTIVAPNFSLTGSDVTISAPGGKGTASIALAPVGGFTGTVNFTCSVPSALTETKCSLSPASLSGSGSTTLSISTTAPSAAQRASNRNSLRLLFGSLLFAGLLIGRRSRRLLATFCLGALLVFLLSCGGGSSSSGPTSLSNPGTPSGTYTVVVTGTSGSGASQITATTNIKVVVN